MRLIDADALINKIIDDREIFGLVGSESGEAQCDFAIDRIEEATTVDAVEVVRCKDCKWRGDEDVCPMTYKDEWYDEDDGWDFRIVDQADDEGFCHRGERWSEDEEI